MRTREEIEDEIEEAEDLISSGSIGRPDSVYLRMYASALKWALGEEDRTLTERYSKGQP